MARQGFIGQLGQGRRMRRLLHENLREWLRITTGCPRRETACSVCMFLIDCMGPTGARRMSRLRRHLLPVTGSGFTAPDVHSRSWRRHAREFEVKPLSFRLKPQPIASAVATLVGKTSFTVAGK